MTEERKTSTPATEESAESKNFILNFIRRGHSQRVVSSRE